MLFEWHDIGFGDHTLVNSQTGIQYVGIARYTAWCSVYLYPRLVGGYELIEFMIPTSELSEVKDEVQDLVDLYFPGSTIRNPQ